MMPLVRRKPLSFTLEPEGGGTILESSESKNPVIVDVPYGGAKEKTTTAYWEQLIYNNSYQDFLKELKKDWPEALEVVPCLLEKEDVEREAKENKKKFGLKNKEYQLERAWRKVAEAVAKNFAKYERYSKEYKGDALEDLADQIEVIRPMFSKLACPKEAKDEKKPRLGVH